jgi:hypothetical protein
MQHDNSNVKKGQVILQRSLSQKSARRAALPAIHY